MNPIAIWKVTVRQTELRIPLIKYEEHACCYNTKMCNYVLIAAQGLHVFNEVHIVRVGSNKNEKSYRTENLIYMIIHINLLEKVKQN